MTDYILKSVPLIIGLVTIGLSAVTLSARVNDENCEVCVKFVRRFSNEGIPDEDKYNSQKIIGHFKKFCKKARGKDERFCYYVGGLDISATFIVKTLSDPMAIGMPAEKVCEKLKATDSQICELKYEKKADLKTANFQKMRVKQLKKVLEDWGEACVGCTEKRDFIKLIEEKLPVYDPEAAAFRAKQKSEL